jgi:hypothetical protein
MGAARLLLGGAEAFISHSDASNRWKQPLRQAKEIGSLASSGSVSITQAAQLVAALGTVGKLIEVDELERRIQTSDKKEAAHTNPLSGYQAGLQRVTFYSLPKRNAEDYVQAKNSADNFTTGIASASWSL